MAEIRPEMYSYDGKCHDVFRNINANMLFVSKL